MIRIPTFLTSKKSRQEERKLARWMVHDLRTPISAAKGILNLALQETNDPNKIQQRLATMESIMNHIQRVVDNTLDYNQIAENKLLITQREFNLSQLIKTVREIIYPLTQAKGQIFATKVADIIEEYLIGDDIRIQQILINLLSNSVKYTSIGGTINFQIKQIKQKDSTITTQFQVSDSGIGFSPDFAERIFELFEKEKSDGYPEQVGTGVGLYITNNLVKMMNGNIRVNSKPKCGSVFIVELPLAITDRAKSEGETQKTQEVIWGNYDFSGRHLLIAEDDLDSLDIMSELLEKTGLSVRKAVDGAEAVRIFCESPVDYYDVILLDVIMPNVNGVEAAERIRRLDRQDAKRIPLISITGDTREEVGENECCQAFNAGVLKPVNYRVLYELLNHYLNCSNGENLCHKQNMKQSEPENQ